MEIIVNEDDPLVETEEPRIETFGEKTLFFAKAGSSLNIPYKIYGCSNEHIFLM